MKLVFFDLQRSLPPSVSRKDDSVYSTPLGISASQAARARSAVQTANLYYNSTVMNFYGDSFHLNRQPYNYSWNYVPVDPNLNPNRMVVKTKRFNNELQIPYQPLQVNLPMGVFVTPSSCQPGIDFVTPSPTSKPWPTKCTDIDDAAIHRAMNGSASVKPSVGFILLNGKRLGNLSAIEAIPNKAIVDFYNNQKNDSVLGAAAGEIQYNGGSRDGVGGPYSVVKECKTKSLNNCYLGRFGWLGDRVSLEDQVANAAFIEMNMTTKTGYGNLYPNGSEDPIRYNVEIRGATRTCSNWILIGWPLTHAGSAIQRAPSLRLPCRTLSQARKSFGK
jgi:hypothetical protein